MTILWWGLFGLGGFFAGWVAGHLRGYGLGFVDGGRERDSFEDVLDAGGDA